MTDANKIVSRDCYTCGHIAFVSEEPLLQRLILVPLLRLQLQSLPLRLFRQPFRHFSRLRDTHQLPRHPALLPYRHPLTNPPRPNDIRLDRASIPFLPIPFLPRNEIARVAVLNQWPLGLIVHHWREVHNMTDV